VKTPAIIVVSGPPCSGKTTIADKLSTCLGFIHLEMDALRIRLLPESDHKETDRDIAYRAMHLIAELLLRVQKGVVLDATYTRRMQRLELRDLATRTGANLYLIQCSASSTHAVARFLQRCPGKHAAIDLTPVKVAESEQRFTFVREALILHTDKGDVDECFSAVVSYLKSEEPLSKWDWIENGE